MVYFVSVMASTVRWEGLVLFLVLVGLSGGNFLVEVLLLPVDGLVGESQLVVVLMLFLV
jgi:hypothetical protein